VSVRGFLRDWSLKPPEAGLSPDSLAAAGSNTICPAINQSRANLRSWRTAPTQPRVSVRGFLRDWSLKPPEAGLSSDSLAAAGSNTICPAINQSRTNLRSWRSHASQTHHRLRPESRPYKELHGSKAISAHSVQWERSMDIEDRHGLTGGEGNCASLKFTA